VGTVIVKHIGYFQITDFTMSNAVSPMPRQRPEQTTERLEETIADERRIMASLHLQNKGVEARALRGLVEEAFTSDGAAKARNAVSSVDLALKLIVVGELLVCEQSANNSIVRVLTR
jgi:hypothetical protein